MRKISLLFALMLFAVFGAVAQNNNRYSADGFGSTDGMLAEIETGVQVALSPATSTSESFLVGSSTSSTITDDGVFEFLVAEQVGDTTVYYLKQSVSGKYLSDPAYSSTAFAYTDSKLRAAKFVASHPHYYESTALVDSALKYNEEGFSWYTFTTDAISGNEPYIFKLCARTTANSRGILSLTTSLTWSNTYASNTWAIYPVTKKGAFETLYDVFTELFPNGEKSYAIFIGGDDPGQIDQAYVDELKAAYAEAQDYLNYENGDDEKYAASTLRIQTAYANCQNNIKPMREGYFYFSNWRTAAKDNTPIEDNAVYENITSHETEWTWTSGWTQPDVPTAETANFIYHIIESGDQDSTFYIQNLYTKRYLGYTGSLYTKIPTTEQAEEKYHITIHPSQPGMFSVRSTSREKSTSSSQYNYPAMHTEAGATDIVFWTAESDPSAWYFREIPAEEITAVEEGLVQVRLNNSLSELVETAQAAYKKGFSYSSNASEDSNYDDPGLVTEVSQLWTNAQEASEGPIANALDSNFNTYFHTAWNADPVPFGDAQYHNICADLGEAVSAVSVKITKRANKPNDVPGTVHFYATNDTTGFAAGDYSKWVDQGVVEFEYPYKADYGSGETANCTGINTCAFDGQYRYVRLDVVSRLSGTTHWFNLSEIRFYEAEYDPSTSLINAVPQEIVDELLKQIETANDEITDGAATQATYDALTAAYDNFVANYPDPTKIAEAKEEAVAQAEAAEEGDGLGYFEAGAKETLQAALDAVEVKDVMTISEINEGLAAIEAALAEFNSKLIKPEDGKYYWLKVGSKESHNGNYVYAQDNGNNQVKWGGHSATEGDDANVSVRLNYIWKAVKNEDGSYSFQNAATGTYMECQETNDEALNMQQDAEGSAMTLRSAKAAGLFNLVQAEGVYMNAQPGTNNVVTWGSASGTDNSAFQFVEAEWGGTYYVDITSTNAKAVTLPFSIDTENEGVHFYSVLGVKDGEIQLAEIAEETTIPAGTPFIIIAEEGTTGFNYYPTNVAELTDLTYTFEATSQNGMTGTIPGTKLAKGAGYLADGKMLLSDGTNSADANSAFFTNALTETTETGAASIPMEGMPTVDAGTATGVDAVSINTGANGKMYDLQGRRVLKAQKGLYIINGKKVYVK